ncbi:MULTISPECIES: 50S ribosomal protein L32 [unclassified Meiothermus]|uniref:50S ribosomal protein L32 n=1 Tax=unclassified Meiothermus TaxID=370471 RepID=UPI000D7C29B8|nr:MULTISPECIES: 50S ribosomal protein L32 [unclassified Meiothermus]PZA06589.1 50S ribosomal protein L32 [Meiothermus sp. Pnk-1]RYM37692.1 50S ribosomal protein L32 [Meiothermus sp. PNK-Is4]
MAKHPVPKKKTSKARRDSRRSHHALTPPTLVACPECKTLKPPHTVCSSCGYYDGRKVLEV